MYDNCDDDDEYGGVERSGEERERREREREKRRERERAPSVHN